MSPQTCRHTLYQGCVDPAGDEPDPDPTLKKNRFRIRPYFDLIKLILAFFFYRKVIIIVGIDQGMFADPG